MTCFNMKYRSHIIGLQKIGSWKPRIYLRVALRKGTKGRRATGFLIPRVLREHIANEYHDEY